MKFFQSAILSLVIFTSAAVAGAQTVGVRAGVSGDPGQFYGGLHYESGPLVDRLRFRPNVEIGVGDDVTLVAVNVEFAYRIPVKRAVWDVYLGAGPALVIRDFTDDTDVGGGFNILVGLQHRKGLFTELKVGMADSPNIKFAVGYAF